MKLEPSLQPQNLRIVNEHLREIWYYEENDGIEFFGFAGGKNQLLFKVSKAKLIRSLSRITGVDIKKHIAEKKKK